MVAFEAWIQYLDSPALPFFVPFVSFVVHA
jgi:hypothetical protein